MYIDAYSILMYCVESSTANGYDTVLALWPRAWFTSFCKDSAKAR